MSKHSFKLMTLFFFFIWTHCPTLSSSPSPQRGWLLQSSVFACVQIASGLSFGLIKGNLPWRVGASQSGLLKDRQPINNSLGSTPTHAATTHSDAHTLILSLYIYTYIHIYPRIGIPLPNVMETVTPVPFPSLVIIKLICSRTKAVKLCLILQLPYQRSLLASATKQHWAQLLSHSYHLFFFFFYVTFLLWSVGCSFVADNRWVWSSMSHY